ncbi:hypothetical protein [Geodermatophilus ruber]|uniref:Uncharacterized protein n=1 Tax=Geodermatophilus ruber TaxID=504800 RepID=A0A1I4DJW5_9ACTN|nr:hypothetical protein [Geodermatophilus ruber]SFK92296.1 hypothetical protein SAMN04488085_104369 [Geodermatophilus ruber]
MWLWWVLGGLAVWLVLALAAALVLGLTVRLADQRAGLRDDVPSAARRRVPFPRLGVGLVAGAVALTVVGYAVEVSGASGQAARLLALDSALPLARVFVVLLFAVAALAAIAGAGRIPGRRTWWSAVGVAAAGIAALEAGTSRAHAAFEATSTTVVASAAGAAVVTLGALWFLSRSERRDRSRILLSLAAYAAVSVGLSAVSAALAGAYGTRSGWATGATLVEHLAEALAAVVFLLAVLIGVAPRLVLPADWVLRRAADAHTLDVEVPGPAGRPASR